jgi:hypothetical protein
MQDAAAVAAARAEAERAADLAEKEAFEARCDAGAAGLGQAMHWQVAAAVQQRGHLAVQC